MKRILPIVILALAVFSLPSCQLYSSIVHDEDVVARVGEHVLYRSQLEKMVPAYVSPEDSAAMVTQYINNWATELLYMDMAAANLSEEEMDVSRELEEYRRALLRFRYEQRYINDRLDTLVTENQVAEYYKNHKDDFILVRPVLKFRYAEIPDASSDKNEFLRKMSGENVPEELDSIARDLTVKYYDSSDKWVDAAVVAKDFGTDYTTMLKSMYGKMIKMKSEDGWTLKVAYVCDIVSSGPAPMDFCASRIRDVIISKRKHDLVSTLEQDLLEDAQKREYFEIYQQQ